MAGNTGGAEPKDAGASSSGQAEQGAVQPPVWGALLKEATDAGAPPEIRAETFIKAWQTASRPVAVKCSDGQTYVIKGSNAGRQAVNDCVAAKLAAMIGAPVPPSALITIPEELRLATPEMQHLASGKAHGSKVMEECTEREAFANSNEGDNRRRFASIAILYGWLLANDRQFIYGKFKPHNVYSVDHGHFFPGGPDWNVAGLAGAPAAVADAETVTSCALKEDELRVACCPLHMLTVKDIAVAVAAVPDGWNLSSAERIALCEYLEKRRTELTNNYPILETESGEKG